MDGVIADVETQYLRYYEKEYGQTISRQSIRGVSELEVFPEGVVVKMLHSPGFFRTLPVMDGAVEAVKSLMETYEVYIVSAAMEFPLSLFEKREWLAEHFPFISWKNIIFCGDKSIIHTDFMIDDHCKNLDTCRGKAIMFEAFHNVNQAHHVRLKHWRDALPLLESFAGSV